MAEQIPGTYPKRLTVAGRYLADMLESFGHPVLTPYAFFRFIERMYREKEGKRLYLRHDTPTEDDCIRLRQNLKKAGAIGYDRDYGNRIIRVLSVSDMPAEEIVCLADPICYVSHLSAMQIWGLTDRSSDALIITRPNRSLATEKLKEVMSNDADGNARTLFPLKNINHPPRVRHRPIQAYETKTFGTSVQTRSSFVRLATIGQTFLDMLQKPEYCGGMSHVLDAWDEHAKTYIDDIIGAVDTATNKLVKSRAGYILEERLGIQNNRVETWKVLGQRGSSRKLDPSKEFAPVFSATWMISLNV